MGILAILIYEPESKTDLDRMLTASEKIADEIVVISSQDFDSKKYKFIQALPSMKKRALLNKGLDEINSDWILFLNGKEVVFRQNLLNLKNYLKKRDDANAFMMEVRRYCNESQKIGWIPSSEVPGFNGFFKTKEVRLFKNDSRILFSESTKPSVLESLSGFSATLKEIRDVPVHSYNQEENIDLKSLEDFVEKNPRDLAAKYRLGVAYMNSGNFQSAREQFVSVANKDDSFEFVLSNLGVVMLKLGHPDEAVKLFTRALQKNPEDLAALNNLAVTLRKQKKFAEAEKLFKKALQMNPHDPRTYKALALTYLDQGKKDDAKRLLQAGAKFHKNSPILKDVLSKL